MARTSAIERMRVHLDQLLAARGQPAIHIKADLLGRQAELWQRAVAATAGLGEAGGPLGAADLIGLLLGHGLPILEAACQGRRAGKHGTSPATPTEPGKAD